MEGGLLEEVRVVEGRFGEGLLGEVVGAVGSGKGGMGVGEGGTS